MGHNHNANDTTLPPMSNQTTFDEPSDCPKT